MKNLIYASALLFFFYSCTKGPSLECSQYKTLPPSSNDPETGGSSGNTFIDSMVLEINDYRESHGLPVFIWNDDIAAVAQAHSDNMEAQLAPGDLQHILDGQNNSGRLDAAGVEWSANAENLAEGTNEVSIVNAWDASPAHQDNLKDNKNLGWLYHGVGFSATENKLTHIMLRPPCAD